jgi:alginate O-acetyltransferase complex protein AlgI
MLFNSLAFGLFLAVVYPVWRVLGGLHRRRWLLFASLFFYGWWDPRFLALLLATSTLDWYCALRIESGMNRRAWVTLSIVSNLASLAVFKYLGFFSRELVHFAQILGVEVSLPTVSVLLPVGLSFYTFQAIAYTIDVYRSKTAAAKNLGDFLLFISFFPQLVAGPIERSGRLLPQLAEARTPTAAQMGEGAWLILLGYTKKLLIADNLGWVVARGLDVPGARAGAIALASYAFTWQIYCDFSGYSDIARGVAKWLGIDLMVNFNLPFFASSPRDIWKRWHISLSEWLRDYLYIPLGGNRAGRNLLLTMVLGGLWHGANWTYLAWGAWHGTALAIQRRVSLRLPRPLAIVATFHFLVAGFVLFRVTSLDRLPGLARSLLALEWVREDLFWARYLLLLAAPLFLLELAMYRSGDPLVVLRLPRPVQALGVVATVAAVLVLGASHGTPFIYFQF